MYSVPVIPSSASQPTGSTTKQWTRAVQDLVSSTEVPLAAIELPSGTILAVNEAFAVIFDRSIGEITGSSTTQWVAPEDRALATAALEALASGQLTGYQAVRQMAGDGPGDRKFGVWVTAIDLEGHQLGLASYIPFRDKDPQFQPLGALTQFPIPGAVVLGTADSDWRVDRISVDVEEMLGIAPTACQGLPVLGVLHPSDVAVFVAAVEHARRGQRAIRITLRLRKVSGEWSPVTTVLSAISRGEPPALAFALMRLSESPESAPSPSHSSPVQLQVHLEKIADELRAAGVIPRLDRLPAFDQVPALSMLTSREWEVVVRLLEGERVPGIAADMFLSQSTIRNYLSAVYAKLGVHSQGELIRLLRGRRGEQ